MPFEKVSWWRRLFPPRVNFLDLLSQQTLLTQSAVQALHQWSVTKDDGDLERIADIEKKSDELRERLVGGIARAFETPLDREDINDLSRHLKDLVDGVRYAARRIRATKMNAPQPAQNMLLNIHDGLGELELAIQALPKHPADAWKHADRARHSQRRNEDIEADGIAEAFKTDDVKELLRQREMLGIVLLIGRTLELTGENMVHAINKLG